MKKSYLLLLSLISLNANAAVNITCIAHALPTVTGVVNRDTYLFGSHDIEIVNDTNSDYQTTYVYSLCPDFRNCSTFYNRVTVKPYSKWNNHKDHSMTVSYTHASNYNFIVSTKVADKTCEDYGSIRIS